jgi:cyclopropane-fatty-acyl-phospholipid synthase
MTPQAIPPSAGASREAIAAHYDLGNDFFALWLDRSLTYTCALWEPADPHDTLSAAQDRKNDRMADLCHARGAARILDVGCGWGGAMARLATVYGAGQVVGLTLSRNQAEYVAARGLPNVHVRLEGWESHRPDEPYDAIYSIEAFEAFARPGLALADKIAAYRRFFASCHDWLKPGGHLALQVITHGNSGPEDADGFMTAEVFPESELPKLADIAAASDRRFEVLSLQNDRDHYVRTLEAWLTALKANRTPAAALVGQDVVVRFERYLRLCNFMFASGACDLLRLAFRRIDKPHRPL